MTAINHCLMTSLTASVVVASAFIPGSAFAAMTTEAETNRPGGDYKSIDLSGTVPRPVPVPAPAPAAKTPEACPVSSCSKGVATLNQPQDGARDCVTTAVIPCFPYSCDGSGKYCGSSCSANADCAPGAHCNTTLGACAPYGYVCKDTFTVESSDGSDTSCSPYKCVAGQCRDSCSAPADCDRNHSCIGGVCVKM